MISFVFASQTLLPVLTNFHFRPRIRRGFEANGKFGKRLKEQAINILQHKTEWSDRLRVLTRSCGGGT